MRIKKLFLCVFLFLLVLSNLISSAHAFNIRPYGKLGYMAVSPSASDLGFVLADGDGDLDEYLDKQTITYGAGVQMVFPINSQIFEGMETSVGIDMGIYRLFGYEFQASDASSKWNGDEYSFYLGGLVELNMVDSPVMFQAGAGLHFVYWQEERTFEGTHINEYETDSGTETSFGLTLAAGTNLAVGESTTIPVILQLNTIFRYETMFELGIIFGFDIAR